MRIKGKRCRHATVQCTFANELQRAEIRQFVTVNLAEYDAAKVSGNGLDGHAFDQAGVVLAFISDHGQNRGVALVACAAMRDVIQLLFHWSIP